MLAKLRREFIAISMLLVGLVLAGVLGSSLLSNAMMQRSVTMEILKRALQGQIEDVTLGDTTGEQSTDLMLAVVIEVTSDGVPYAGYGNSSIEVPDEMLRDVILDAMTSTESAGKCDDYHVAWMKTETPWGWRIALVDTYSRAASLRVQALTSLVIFFVSMGALFVISYVLSGWALKPVERSWERQRRFVSDASHELKTPLAVILANTQILEGMEGLPEDARRWVDSTADEAGHMKGLVEDLLTLARADEQAATKSGSKRELASVDVSELASRCALEFDAVAFERGCEIACDLPKGITAHADQEGLRRVVRTLLDNATKYARPGSVVSVSLKAEGKRVILSVNNHGETISAEDLKHIFDRFYRTDDARERQSSGGFGLGLAIARSLVESMGGKISASSSDETGTTFTVTL
ncbi:sensor histidine kinase [Thermophilibacter provencensis]|uniref:Sensor-like histidine kinase SenX3 n=1 Tax=Thermophilibacter provencensis TaxID=1852386 RepID=A0ABT7V2X0_9ACTN|nr:HAMP domain-containing sensor histidine kinase [Thermophilibacter provencensis]MDM8270934.1 HAMP domain-containing sensor histidine kinase [Thermophilibacter provencensis]